MSVPSSWRSLRSVMMLTAHVAAVAYIIRTLAMPRTLTGTLIWVPATISVAVFLSWPIGRLIASAFDPGDSPLDPACPRCGRRDVRPLMKAGAGLFQQVTGYRCVACWTTFRGEGSTRVVEPGSPAEAPADASGIDFLSDPLAEDELRFLDEPAES